MEPDIKDLQEENELLLLQLHQVQEELESYFLRCQALEREQGRTGAGVPGQGAGVDEQLPEALAEVARLTALVETQTKVHRIEAGNALNVRLGNILIRSITSTGNLLGTPATLLKIWRQSEAREIPAALGGKSCDKLVAAYGEGGFDAASGLLDQVAAPVVKANAWTVLARQIMQQDSGAAAEAARRAHVIDPKPYRLKWLAFRLHEAGEIAEADAMLSLVPPDASFSDSEERQAGQLRYEARLARQREARRQCSYDERRAAAQRQLADLAQDRDTLKKAEAQLGQEKAVLAAQHEEQRKLAEERGIRLQKLAQDRDAKARLIEERSKELEALKKTEAQLRQEKTMLVIRHEEQEGLAAERGEENQLLLLQLHQVQEELERHFLDKQSLETEKAALVQWQEQAVGLAEERTRVLDTLRQENVRLEQEGSNLVMRYNDTVRLVENHGHEFELLRRAHTRLERERVDLVRRYENAINLVEARARELDEFRQACIQLEQEKSEFAKSHADAARIAEERAHKLETLRQAQTRSEQEKSDLAKRYEGAARLAKGYAQELEELKGAKAQLEQEKSELAKRHEEVSKLAEGRAQELDGVKQSHVETVARLQGELQDSRQTASLSVKLQMLREADLADLQSRYQASRARENQQHQLLAKLGERLSTASAYFHQIARNEPPEQLHEDTKTRSGKSASSRAKRRAPSVKEQA